MIKLFNTHKPKITKQYAYELNEKCKNVKAHNYLDFLDEKYSKFKIIDLIEQIDLTPNFKNNTQSTPLKFTKETGCDIVLEFFDKYLPNKSKEVSKIFDGTHPLFLDQKGKSQISIDVNKNGRSCVARKNGNMFLEFFVAVDQTADGLKTLAHETAHALSSHHQQPVKNARNNITTKEQPTLKEVFERDCVGEIESYITEKLFLRFLLKKGIINKQEIENDRIGNEKSLITERNLILEEYDILKQLDCPITYESLKYLTQKLEKENNNVLLKRIEEMHNNKDHHSSYMFRYVVGRIVSQTWIEKFEECTNEERAQMLKNFEDYLDHTHEYKLDDACQKLLGKNFEQIAKSYVEKQNENQNKKETQQKQTTNNLKKEITLWTKHL